MARGEIARRFKCGISTVGDIKKDRATLEKDATDMLRERVNGTATEDANPSNDEPVLDDTEEVDSAGGRAFALPPPFSELSSLFGPLEEHAESCGISEVVYHLRKYHLRKACHSSQRVSSNQPCRLTSEPCFLADNWYRYSLCPRATVIVTYKKYGVWCWICSTMAGRCMPVSSSHLPL